MTAPHASGYNDGDNKGVDDRRPEPLVMLANYLPILIFLIVAAGLGGVLIVLGFLLGPRQPNAEKLAPYECGFEAFEDSRMKFDVRYYLVAILFILFDLEIAFLFPWAVSLQTVGHFGILAMGVFLAILVVGFVYEWKKGALEWD
jgi:NADH-quinone oxidoreductase subunit A